jgi:hypothetical protein
VTLHFLHFISFGFGDWRRLLFRWNKGSWFVSIWCTARRNKPVRSLGAIALECRFICIVICFPIRLQTFLKINFTSCRLMQNNSMLTPESGAKRSKRYDAFSTSKNHQPEGGPKR